MNLFVTLTAAGSGRRRRINPLAIAYVDVAGEDTTLVAFGSGESFRVTETPEEVDDLVAQSGVGAVLQRLAQPQADTGLRAPRPPGKGRR